MLRRWLISIPADVWLFTAAVSANVVCVAALGIEIATGSSVRLLVATGVVLMLTFPWTSWTESHHADARRRREARQRGERVSGSVAAMGEALREVGQSAPVQRPANGIGVDPWEK